MQKPYGTHLRFVLLLSTVAIAIAIVFFHVWKLQSVPHGFYQDEAAIGYNALLIGASGFDEHGEKFPIFFRSFDDYKNPLYIYTSAGILKFFDASIHTVRLTSAIFYFIFLIGFILLIRRLFESRIVHLYALIAAGFLPWFFTISRIGFETISQLAVWIWLLFFLHETFQKKDDRRIIFAVLAGFLLGLSLYAYSTSRLLTFLWLGLILSLFIHRRAWKHMGVFLGTFALMCVPYVYFLATHSGAATGRFRGISYLFRDSSLLEKVQLFITFYFKHFSPSFLLISGDGNLRHATQFGGQVYWIVLTLAVLGLIWITRHRKVIGAFAPLLLVGTLFSPIAAALTDDGIPHALRSVLLGLHILLLSCFGIHWIANLPKARFKWAILTLIFVVLTVESSAYLRHYFVHYPIQSRSAFDTAGMDKAVPYALVRARDSVMVSDNKSYALYEFYRHSIANIRNIPLRYGKPEAKEGQCVVFFPDDREKLDAFDLPYEEQLFEGGTTQVRCY